MVEFTIAKKKQQKQGYVWMYLVEEVGSGCRDELPVLPVFVSQLLITRALCAS